MESTPYLRNAAAIAAAVIIGYVAMQPFIWISILLTEGRRFDGAAGELLLRALQVMPWVAAAVALGATAALTIATSRPQRWALWIGLGVAASFAVTVRYLAPDLVAWMETAAELSVTGSVAAAVYWFIRRKASRTSSA